MDVGVFSQFLGRRKLTGDTSSQRARGGGRKPRGEFAAVDAFLGRRLPIAMKRRLQALAKKHRCSARKEALTAIERWLKTQKD
jgi:hypothetical protein